MVGDILVKTDWAAMAHSLELRALFLDKDVAEFCFSLPFDHKVTFFQDITFITRYVWRFMDTRY